MRLFTVFPGCVGQLGCFYVFKPGVGDIGMSPPVSSQLSVIITWYVSDGGGRGSSSSSTAGAGAVQIQTTGIVTGINHVLRRRGRGIFAAVCCNIFLRHDSLRLLILREELGGRGGWGEVVEGGEGHSVVGELLGLLDPGPGLQHGLGLEPVAGVEVD